jgi:ATP-dependent Clp protease protease subunit
MNKFWNWNVNASGENELILDGVIASESWWEDEVTPKMFREELEKHQGNVVVRLNSPGGDVFAGVAIYNMLNEHNGEVTIKVDGIAASIASLIAMAGDKIVMLPGSMMMVHLPWTFAAGNADDLAQVVESLEKCGESMVPIYVARTGLSEERINELLKAETWMTAEDAVELGFADEAVEAKTTISDSIKNALNFATDVKSAVMQPVMSMQAKKPKQKAEVTEIKETDVTDTTKEPAKAPTEEPKASIKPKADTKQPKATEPAEPVAAEKDNQPKETEMTEQEKIAASQVLEPKDQANPGKAPTPKLEDYLKSNASMEAFAEILQSNPGDMGGGSSAKVRAAWKEHLEVKAGVTNPSVFLPTPLVEAIQNAFEDGGEIWNRVSKAGVDVWNAAWDTEDDVNSNDGRARGYNRADAEEKAEQVLTFDTRVIRPQFVYKYITLNKEDIKEQRSTGALVTYILSELPQRIVREVERAIVLGDGRASDDDYKIKPGTPRGFYPLLADANANNYFGGVLVLEGDESKAEAVAMAKDELRTGGEVVLIAKKGYSTSARFEKDSEGRLLFPLGSKASDVLDINTIIEPDWFNDTNSPDVDALVTVLSAYKVVGDTTIEGFQNFILKTNKQEYLQEIWAGGGLTGRKAVIALPAATS